MNLPHRISHFSKFPPKFRTALFVLFFLIYQPSWCFGADLSFSPLWVGFNIVPVGDTAFQTLTLSNYDFSDPINIDEVSFTSNSQGVFDISPSVNFPAVIAPGESIEIELSFTPADWGFAEAGIGIYNSSDNRPSLYIYLSGAGLKR